MKHVKLTRRSLVLSVLSASLLSAASSFAMNYTDSSPEALRPSPRDVYIRGISYGGSGCPQGSVGKSLSADRTSMTLIFDSFVASVGPDIPITESRKSCQINVDLRIPQGWSYTIGTIDYRGYVDLASRQIGRQKSFYYFQGSFQQASSTTMFRGPVVKDYLIRDTLALNSVVWSDCNKIVPLNIKTQVNIDNRRNRRGYGMLTTDSIDGKVKRVFGFQWKRCR